jgi:hypothetical protein
MTRAVRFECPCGKSQSSVRGFHTVRFSTGPELFAFCSLQCLHGRVSALLEAENLKPRQPQRFEFADNFYGDDE